MFHTDWNPPQILRYLLETWKSSKGDYRRYYLHKPRWVLQGLRENPISAI